MGRILLLEDDEMLSQTILGILRAEGHEVYRAINGREAYELTFSTHYDLYLFDVNIPIFNGFEVLRELRNAGDTTPAFFITALNDIDSIARGFKAGANDYIKKPFDLDEFLIRVRAVLKRKEKVVVYRDIVFESATKQVLINGLECDLSPVERMIFSLLIHQLGRTVSKDSFYEIMEKSSDAALRVHVNRLKQKLGISITNIRSVGYRLESS
ncbi:response regulator transcription factor [Sulfurimonas sp.]|uniref:response regulator transcription factor n=1 Tax=Sulfurimonas sp. TaxID=2022749 RepID=UPI0025E0D88A|nr:response regulator transcription factor [Sulfurimonas sp.]MDD5156602.1 response regulator transcription factor [Sulfurimonas sp.]